jgi:hypothetical protein
MLPSCRLRRLLYPGDLGLEGRVGDVARPTIGNQPVALLEPLYRLHREGAILAVHVQRRIGADQVQRGLRALACCGRGECNIAMIDLQ